MKITAIIILTVFITTMFFSVTTKPDELWIKFVMMLLFILPAFLGYIIGKDDY